MGNSPKENLARLTQILNAWEQMAANKSFGGMDVIQFRAIVARSIAARDLLEDLADQIVQATTERGNADEAALDAAQRVVNGVRADPTEGDNSALIEGMGYTRSSERRSGLTKKKKGGPSSTS